MVQFTDNSGRFLQALNEAAQEGVEVGALVAADFAVRKMGTRHGGVSAGGGMPPNTQSGQLRNSITWTGSDFAGGISAAYGSNLRYAKIQEQGGVIFPRSGKFLAIPQSPETRRQTARGVLPRSIINAYKFDRGRPLEWIKTRSGATLIARTLPEHRFMRGKNKGKVEGRRSEPLFLLVRRVRIKPHPYLARAYIDNKAAIEQRIFATTKAAMARRFKGVA